MTEFCFAPIVEGHGEVRALPILLHRIALELGFPGTLSTNNPIRVKVGQFLTSALYRQRHLELAANKVQSHLRGVVLVLFDSEDQCPAQLGPQLTAAIARHRLNSPVIVNLAYREFETWYIHGCHSLRGVAGFSASATPHPKPHLVRDAKGWLGEQMPSGYDATTHQHLMARHVSLQEAKTCPSFARLHREVRRSLFPSDSV